MAGALAIKAINITQLRALICLIINAFLKLIQTHNLKLPALRLACLRAKWAIQVGHMTIGAGRVIFQDLPRINKAITDGVFAKNSKLQNLIADLKASKKTCRVPSRQEKSGL